MNIKGGKSPMKKKMQVVKIILIIAILSLTIYEIIKFFPWILSLKEEATRMELQNYIQSAGIWGGIIILAIQVLQIIIAILPGEPIEILTGMIYGTWGGLVLCLAGILIGTILVYYLVKFIGNYSTKKLLNQQALEKYSFLNDTNKVEVLIFILFFIPGTPKDILTYIVPMIKIHPAHYFTIATFARIPSVLTSTFLGANLIKGNFMQTIFIFLITGVIGLGGIAFHQRFISRKVNK